MTKSMLRERRDISARRLQTRIATAFALLPWWHTVSLRQVERALVGKTNSINGEAKQSKLSNSLEAWVFASSSRSGYERQRAVEALANSGLAPALPVLLVRINDWVPAVRAAAAAGLEQFFCTDRISAWAGAIEQVVALGRAARVDHSQLIEQIRFFLSTRSHLKSLRCAVQAPSREVSRFLFMLEMTVPMESNERYEQLRDAVLGHDIVAATLAIDAISMLPGVQRISLASAACSSVFGAVRSAGLRAALAEEPPAIASLARAMCNDASVGVRSVAIGGLRTEYDRNLVASSMLSALRTAPTARARAVALDVLCALKVADAKSLCEHASTDSSSLMRYTAISRLLGFSTTLDQEDLVLVALQDDSSRVRKIGSAQVAKGVAPPEVDVLLRLMDIKPTSFVSLAQVVSHDSPWNRIYFLLACLSRFGKGEVPATAIESELLKWGKDMVRCFVPPNDVQVKRIAQVWADMRNAPSLHLRERLAEHLRAFGIDQRAIASSPPGID